MQWNKCCFSKWDKLMMLQLKMNYKRVKHIFFVKDTTINYHEQQADMEKQI